MALICSCGLLGVYLLSFNLVDFAVHSTSMKLAPPVASPWLFAAIAILTVLVFALDSIVNRVAASRLYQHLYVHGRNGFYVDAFWRQLARTASQ
jgi:hypothetical protein